MEEFSCRSHDAGDSIVLVIRGEVDVRTAGCLWAELALVAPDAPLIVDCAEIAFIDSAGVRPLEWAARRCAESGATFSVRGVPQSMARILKLLGLETWLTHPLHEAGGLRSPARVRPQRSPTSAHLSPPPRPRSPRAFPRIRH
jgi:anti-anti-sigma factor